MKMTAGLLKIYLPAEKQLKPLMRGDACQAQHRFLRRLIARFCPVGMLLKITPTVIILIHLFQQLFHLSPQLPAPYGRSPHVITKYERFPTTRNSTLPPPKLPTPNAPSSCIASQGGSGLNENLCPLVLFQASLCSISCQSMHWSW